MLASMALDRDVILTAITHASSDPTRGHAAMVDRDHERALRLAQLAHGLWPMANGQWPMANGQ